MVFKKRKATDEEVIRKGAKSNDDFDAATFMKEFEAMKAKLAEREQDIPPAPEPSPQTKQQTKEPTVDEHVTAIAQAINDSGDNAMNTFYVILFEIARRIR